MARTGISIQVSNTVLGGSPNVNTNSMLIVAGAKEVTSGTEAFSFNTPYMLRSASDLDALDITEDNNPDVYKQVNDFYQRGGGSILWLVGVDSLVLSAATAVASWVRRTTVNGFRYRPRQIGYSQALNQNSDRTPVIQQAIDLLYKEGISTVGLVGAQHIEGASLAPDLSTKNAPMVGEVVITNRQGDRPCVGLVLGHMASLSVGTSIGDVGLDPLGDTFYMFDYDSKNSTYLNTPCSNLSLDEVNHLGDCQYIFARTRAPKNGLWLNDGATAVEANTALSTLEAGRTLAALVDELRAFFTPYINSKVPVNKAGDIQSTYKQIVLDNARSAVIVPFIQSGDISDATIDLRAVNDDMVGTRTWEVTLSVQGAPTLRWIDGYAFYVKSLN